MSENLCSCGLPWRDIDDRCSRCKRVIPKDRAEKLELHRRAEDISNCGCSDTVRTNWGSRGTNFEGIFLCNFCDSKAGELIENIPEVENEPRTTIEEDVSKRDVPVFDRSAAQNLEVVENLIANLSNTKKYKKAISSGEFAQFSIIGTNDWEDYASLSISALQLLTMAQINARLELLTEHLERNKNG